MKKKKNKNKKGSNGNDTSQASTPAETPVASPVAKPTDLNIDSGLKERQEDEVEVLKAIYMEDFESLDSDTPFTSWTKEWEHSSFCFRIRLDPTASELRKFVYCYLVTQLPPKYPYLVPQIKVEKGRGLLDAQIYSLQQEMETTAASLIGQEMIFELCTLGQEFLTKNNSVIRGVKQKSAYEQMVDRHERDDREARERMKEQFREMQAFAAQQKKIRDANLIEAVRKEKDALLDRIRAQLRDSKPLGLTSAGAGGFLFDDPVLEESPAALQAYFQTIDPVDESILVEKGDTESKPISGLYGGDSVVSETSAPKTFSLETCTVALSVDAEPPFTKAFIVTASFDDTVRGLMKISSSVNSIRPETARRISVWLGLDHPNILKLYSAQVVNAQDSITIIDTAKRPCLVVLEGFYLNSETLRSFLQQCDILTLGVARQMMLQLLSALAYLHSQDLAHKLVSLDTILVTKRAGSSVVLTGVYSFDLCNAKAKVRWRCPEKLKSSSADVWDFACTMLEGLLGTKFASTVADPTKLLQSKNWTSQMPALVTSFFKEALERDVMRRPSAADLLLHPLLAPENLEQDSMLVFRGDKLGVVAPVAWKTSAMLMNEWEPEELGGVSYFSRYQNDFDELGILGKGGFGEVVKARNKVDGRIYAIKKVKLDPRHVESSKKLLREVQLLSRLHHQFVVRYYQAWVEDVHTGSDESSEGSDYSDSSSYSSSSDFTSSPFSSATGVSKNDLPSSDSLSSDDERDLKNSDWLSNELTLSRTENASKQAESENSMPNGQDSWETPKILYIQMDYCEKKTVADLIKEGLHEERAWCLVRQILEGIAHVHSQGIIHRDLKPNNLFLDAQGNVKIGDFGLATKRTEVKPLPLPIALGSENLASLVSMSRTESLTGGVGTPVYVAPEIVSKNRGDGRYSTKVDMYSLGICFFEMFSPPFGTSMERISAMTGLRSRSVIIPPEFLEKHKQAAHLVKLLLSHTPKERPSAMQLLQSDFLPPRSEEEYLQEAVRTLLNQANSVYYGKLLKSLFGRVEERYKDFTYDMVVFHGVLDPVYGLVFGRVQSVLLRIFTRHGAIRLDAPLLQPKTQLLEVATPVVAVDNDSPGISVCIDALSGKPCIELLDIAGTVVKLPPDLTQPFARWFARLDSPAFSKLTTLKRYTLDKVYRPNMAGGQPRALDACDFDILHRVAPGSFAPEAEALQVVFELLAELPIFAASPYCIIVNHTRLLELLFDFMDLGDPNAKTDSADSLQLETSLDTRMEVALLLEQVEKSITWSQFKAQAVTKLNVAKEDIYLLETASLHVTDDLETVEKRVYEYCSKLFSQKRQKSAGKVFQLSWGSLEALIRDIFTELRLLRHQLSAMKLGGVPFRVSPLFVYNHRYYKGHVMFCVAVPSKRHLDIIAGGGRYDTLLDTFSYPKYAKQDRSSELPRKGGADASSSLSWKGVGVHIALQKLVRAVVSDQEYLLKHPLAIQQSSHVLSPFSDSPNTADSCKSTQPLGLFSSDKLRVASSTEVESSVAISSATPAPVAGNSSNVAAQNFTSLSGATMSAGGSSLVPIGSSPLAALHTGGNSSLQSVNAPWRRLYSRCDVFVACFGKAPQSECMAIASELWAANITCDYLLSDDFGTIETSQHEAQEHVPRLPKPAGASAAISFQQYYFDHQPPRFRYRDALKLRSSDSAVDSTNPDAIMQTAKTEGYGWLVIIKQKGHGDVGFSIKVKNLITRTETPVSRQELVQFLQSEINEMLESVPPSSLLAQVSLSSNDKKLFIK